MEAGRGGTVGRRVVMWSPLLACGLLGGRVQVGCHVVVQDYHAA
jgi:hypothetical protein